MAMVHVYFGMVNLSMNASQKQQLVQALRNLGSNEDMQPCHRNHWRTRPDNDAVIFEALWNEDHISITFIKSYLGNIFGISPSTINHAVLQQTFGVLPTAVVTFSRNGTNYIRIVYFGYSGGGNYPSWIQSLAEVTAYLAANRVAWEGA